MRDYAQYTSRIPSPSAKRYNKTTTTTPIAGAAAAAGTTTPTRPINGSTSTTPTSATRTNGSASAGTPTSKLASPSYLRNRTNSPQDKRERESTSTVSSTNQRQPPQDNSPSPSSSSTPSPKSHYRTRTPTRSAPTPSYASTGSAAPKSPSRNGPAMTMTASDALSLRQHGSEATIVKLRQSLDDATQKDTTAKASLAKSDAVILELRSSLRAVKKQLETLQEDSKEATQRQKHQSTDKVNQLQAHVSDLQHQLAISQSSSKDAKVGELQVQLDRAHAQILTADMVRKELEDTLEAEQYTWELRVQDQERQIAQLQEECDRLQADLDEARSQWKEAEQGWNTQVEELQQQLTQTRTRMAATQALSASKTQEDLEAKVVQLQREQAELQSCLDEALQELEAVDMELQQDGGTPTTATTRSGTNAEVIESLQHLLRWVHQEGPTSTPPKATVFHVTRDPKKLLKDIRTALEEWVKTLDSGAAQQQEQPTGLPASRSMISTGGKSEVTELQSQVEQYQSELKSREESSSELRESLKEAVALLKPLQDAVAKAEQEKQVLKDQLREVEATSQKQQREVSVQNREVEHLKAEIVQLEQQVQEQKSIATARGSLLTTPGGTPNKSFSSPAPGTDDSLSKIQRAREELRRKRETEGNLQQLLKDAQSRFHSLHEQNENTAAKNRELQGKLQVAATENQPPTTPSQEDHVALLKRQLQDKHNQVKQLQSALEENGEGKVRELDAQLEASKKELANREQAEKMLNKSLKDALGLLKPLQLHLEEAEREKMEISRELRNLRKRFRQLQMGDAGDDQSKSTFGGAQDISVEFVKIKEELEDTVRQLELENSQLQDQLEDLSEAATGGGNTKGGGSAMAEARMRQKLVEATSRYELTATKLEDSQLENHALVKALKQKEALERSRQEEMRQLKEAFRESQAELKNAKAIAKSAMIQVDQLTMNNIEQLSRSHDGNTTIGSHTTDLSQPYPLSSPSRNFY